MLAELMITMNKEEFITWAMNDWPRMQAIYIQHLIGSFFCIPSILGIGDPNFASSLAICGVLHPNCKMLQRCCSLEHFTKMARQSGQMLSC